MANRISASHLELRPRESFDADIACKRRCVGGCYLDGAVWGKRVFVGQDGADTGACWAKEFDAG
jgi:hypothetical protein